MILSISLYNFHTNTLVYMFSVEKYGIDIGGKKGIFQGTYTLGRFLAHASILCTVMGADQNKESFPFPGVGSTVYVIVPPRNQRTHFASMR